MSGRTNKDRIEVLQRRHDFLDRQIAAGQNDHYKKAERSALAWAIAKLETGHQVAVVRDHRGERVGSARVCGCEA
jgi:hypothetical protein